MSRITIASVVRRARRAESRIAQTTNVGSGWVIDAGAQWRRC